MPLTSVESAESWVKAHSRRAPRIQFDRKSESPIVGAPSLVKLEVHTDSPFATILRDVHASRDAAYKNLQEAQGAADSIRIGIASKNHSDAVNTALRTEEWVTDQLKERGELVSLSAAKALITKTLSPIAAAFDGFAAANGQRCNPSAPLLAETVLRESIDLLKEQIRGALDSVAPSIPVPAPS